MTVELSSPTALYPQLLGEAWSQLDAAVRHAHLANGQQYLGATGTFEVCCSRHFLVRSLLRLCGMPREARAVTVRLVIERKGIQEIWRRDFGGQRLVSVQEIAPGGLLSEQFGCLEVRLRLAVEGGELVYRHEQTRLRFWRLSVPLPRRLMLQVDAREASSGRALSTRVVVEARHPLVGMLFRYGGELKWEHARDQHSAMASQPAGNHRSV